MSNSENSNGLIPKGLVVGDLRGQAFGSLTIAGSVERSDIKVDEFIVTDTGEVSDGAVEAETVVIEGRVAGTTFRAGRLSAGAGSHIADCIIEMSNPTGCSIDEDAQFEGDVNIAFARREGNSSKVKSSSRGALFSQKKDSTTSEKNDRVDETAQHSDASSSYVSSSSTSNDENSFLGSEKEVEIPLGD